MALPNDAFQNSVQEDVVKNWRMFIDNMEESMDRIEKGLDEAREMTEICTSEWCEATEHVIDDLSNQLFSISEPRWASKEDSDKIKELKRRVHDIYANYKDVYASV